MPPYDPAAFGRPKTPEELEDERQSRLALRALRAQALFEPSDYGALPIRTIRGARETAPTYLYPTPAGYRPGPGRSSAATRQAAVQNYALASRGQNEVEANRIAEMQALAALRSTDVDRQRVEYEAQAAGITPAGAAPTNLIPTPEGVTVPRKVQDAVLQSAIERARNPGVPLLQFLTEAQEQGYTSSPGWPSILALLNSQRGEEIAGLVQAADDSQGYGTPPSPFEAWVLGHRYGSTNPVAPSSAYSQLYRRGTDWTSPADWPVNAQQATELLRRAFPDRFPRR